jgi:hypothetical protein
VGGYAEIGSRIQGITQASAVDNNEGVYYSEQHLDRSFEVAACSQGFLRAPVLARNGEGGSMWFGRVERSEHGGDKVEFIEPMYKGVFMRLQGFGAILCSNMVVEMACRCWGTPAIQDVRVG